MRSVALYGAEIWGWKNETRLDRIKRKYVKWSLRLDRNTPNYILAEEVKMRELRTEAVGRTIRYEEKAKRSRKKVIVECFRELDKERREEEENKWERARKVLLKRVKIEKEEFRKRIEKERIKM